MSEFIKIPTDFKSLHDLKDLVHNFDLVSRLSNALNDYQRAHIDSYLMTYNQVLEYIPLKDQENYKVFWVDREMRKYLGYNEKTEKYEYATELYPRLFKAFEKESYGCGVAKVECEEPEQKRIYMVDTLNKRVDIVYWAENIKLPDIKRDYGKIDYEITEDKILVVKVNYTFTAHQTVGGVWINGRARGYLSGGTSVPYTSSGYSIYHFDTKTNQYIGYKGEWQEEGRPWVESKSGW